MPLLEGAASTIGDAPIAAFGECSHFTQALHDYANDLFRYLVEKKGFRVFMLESAWAANDYLTEFIASDRPAIDGWMNFYLNAFVSARTEQTLLYIRDFNRKHPDDPIAIAGMQPEQPWTDFRELKAVLAKAGLELPADDRALIERTVFAGRTFENDIDVIGFHGRKAREKQRIMAEGDPAGLAAALDRVDEFLQAHQTDLSASVSPAAFKEAKLRVLGLRFYGLIVLPMRDFYALGAAPDPAQVEKLGHDGYHFGDLYRFEIIKTQRETRFPGKKIFIWMHSWHAAKASESINCTIAGQPPLGTISLGTRLFREYGRDYRVVASVVAAPASFVFPPGVETIDQGFQKVFGARAGYVDIQRPGPGLDSLPLGRMLPQYSHIDNEYGGGIVLKDQFDGVAYFPASDLTVKKK
ncbi:MAG TPA: erythromycin esterase family protein [Candidatus Aminicenantes bacterium]|nr:erythromycin esterase family protein [Candidatus Aminicenantes bacterium]HRY66185.1 erythromycin esterase family protein [Candidatus Aminicenantes bacterium]HRZ73099.1 erythromycin esterase family protein [Candidatus Aminicenantes bacterium]